MEENPTRICELLVGLGDVEVLGVDDASGGPLGVHIRSGPQRPPCGAAAARSRCSASMRPCSGAAALGAPGGGAPASWT